LGRIVLRGESLCEKRRFNQKKTSGSEKRGEERYIAKNDGSIRKMERSFG